MSRGQMAIDRRAQCPSGVHGKHCMHRLRSSDGQSWRSPLTDNVGTAEHRVPSHETQVSTVSPRSHQRGKHRFRPNRCGSQRKGGLRTTKHQEESVSTLRPGKGFTAPPGAWGVRDHPRSAAAESELHKDAAVSSQLLGQCQPILFKGLFYCLYKVSIK